MAKVYEFKAKKQPKKAAVVSTTTNGTVGEIKVSDRPNYSISCVITGADSSPIKLKNFLCAGYSYGELNLCGAASTLQMLEMIDLMLYQLRVAFEQCDSSQQASLLDEARNCRDLYPFVYNLVYNNTNKAKEDSNSGKEI